MSGLGTVRNASRNDSGFVLIAVLVDLTITALLLTTLIGFMFFAARLVQSASPDTNPLVWSTLTTSVARLEGSIASPLGCANPPTATTRSDCLTVKADPIRPIIQPGVESPEVACWLVTNDEAKQLDGTPLPDQRRLECWELLETGYLWAWVYDHAVPDSSTPDPNDFLPDTSDRLAITDWQPSPNSALSRTATHGLAAVEWQCLTTNELAARQVGLQNPDDPNDPYSCIRSSQFAAVELVACAAIKPKQRNLMEPGLVPFCDGTTGVVLSDGSYRGRDNPNHPDPNDRSRSTIEGYLLPAINLDMGGS